MVFLQESASWLPLWFRSGQTRTEPSGCMLLVRDQPTWTKWTPQSGPRLIQAQDAKNFNNF
jgi:hypothetical protein